MNRVKFHPVVKSNERKRLTTCNLQVCIYYGNNALRFNVTTRAKCHPEDQFNKEFGERLAKSRAYEKAEKIAIRQFSRLLKSLKEVYIDAENARNKLDHMLNAELDYRKNNILK